MKFVSPIVFRLVWWNHVDPAKRASFADDLYDSLLDAFIRTYEDDSDNPMSLDERSFAKEMGGLVIKSTVGDIFNLLPAFEDSSFERFVNKLYENRHLSSFNEMFAMQFDTWTSRIAGLSGSRCQN